MTSHSVVNTDAIELTETDDLVESERRIAEWISAHGQPTHVLLWCGPNIITTTGRPTTVAVALRQHVTPCAPSATEIVPITDDLVRGKLPAGRLGLFEYCYLPLICATERTEDAPFLVRVRKIGVSQLHNAEPAHAN